ncbi:MAG: hydroxyisourate hydrolase [Gordonia sp. (in: high G+C Gram-positive bacteria)]|uniref:hydroxyisourate hydrolase n=1 Tax=Gordonia sp. (in: high G+C Gram-positive bacteria) TaxID=84139 RepID=UPI0039E5BD40
MSTHVLDTTTGRPAAGIAVDLYGHEGKVASGVTNGDGRIPGFATVPSGRYTAVFGTGEYFPDGLYPVVSITMNLKPGKVHLPLLLSPFAYSTYRGS